ncbi:hypothetical protein BZG36_01498 [Bifiguratus adelaidae]|uniref:Sodium/calcium exchanger membrane region domain-containing protein n=1 Tax=Bifiguratus adelaidae TaxID=1938954 RepID=A0A261Y4S9_9FUNG|nr:hypothetical protein BZG36_01498 [Bifiguratus adelaidae]
MLPHIEDISSYAGRVVVYVILFLLALVLLEVGADIFVDSTAIVAKRHHIPEVLIALLTAGAEWEELAVVISAIAQGNPDLALGNIIGSCISNILGAFSIGLLFPKVVEVDRSSKLYGAALLIFSLISSGLVYGEALDKPSGGVLIALFAVYHGSIGYGIYRGVMAEPEDSDDDSDSDSDDDHVNDDTAPASPERSESQEKLSTCARHHFRQLKRTTTYHVIALLFGLALMSVSGWLLSGSATAFAAYGGISNTVVGLTIVALATTLPEKFVAVFAGHRGHTGVLVANTVGSDIFLLTLVLGILGVSSAPVIDVKTRFYDISVMLGSVIVLAGCLMFNYLRRWIGLAMLVVYLAYVISNYFIFKALHVSITES